MIRRSGSDGGCIYANAEWLSLTGRRLDDELGHGWLDAVHPQDRVRCLELLHCALDTHDTVTLDYRLRRSDGAWRWLEERAAASDGEGAGGLLHAAFDVTEHQAAKARLQQLVEQQQVSFRELRHRTTNRTQMILSLLRLQAAEATEPGVRAALETATRRVQALVRADQRLDAAPDGVAPRLADCLHELVAALQPSFEQRAIGLEIDLADSELPARMAGPLGLLVNELLTNSLKHAFPEGRGGQVRLVATRAAGSLKILVADDGIGLPGNVEPHRTPSSGMQLIGALARQIGAKVTVTSERGACFTLMLPLE